MDENTGLHLVRSTGELTAHFVITDDPDYAEEVALCGETVREFGHINTRTSLTVKDICKECCKVLAREH